MNAPRPRPHGATAEQWARHWEAMRGQSLILVDSAFDAVARDLQAGNRRAAAVVAKFETDQSQAVDGIADALFTLLTMHIRRVITVTAPGIPSRAQATTRQARMVER